MDSIDRENVPSEPQPSRRRRLGALALLVALTLVGAVAARGTLPEWGEGIPGLGAGIPGWGADPTPGGGSSPDGVRLGGGPSSPVRLEAQIDRGSVLQGGDGTLRMELVIRADDVEAASASPRVATDLVVVLDRSGSMSGDPLAHAQAAVGELVAQLRDEDRFALVTYASDAHFAIPLAAATPAARAGWLARLGGVEARGGTNMALGLDLATMLVDRERSRGRATRVILLSDGHANEGDRSAEGLRSRARRAVAGEYVLSSVGVGLGFDERLMSALADAGTGNFYYVRHGEDLGRVFAGEFASARATVASALAVAIQPGPGVEVLDAAGYPLERDGRAILFRPGSLFAGQERRVWVTLRAPTTRPGELALGKLSLRYSQDGRPTTLQAAALPQIACVENEDEFFASVSEDVFDRALASEGIGALKRSVAAAVEKGDRQAAERELSRFRDENRSYYRHWGRDAEESDSYAVVDELGARVAQAFGALLPSSGVAAVRGPMPAAPARAAEERNALGKELLAESVDDRREGAKSAP